jgi:hypothetical protein
MIETSTDRSPSCRLRSEDGCILTYPRGRRRKDWGDLPRRPAPSEGWSPGFSRRRGHRGWSPGFSRSGSKPPEGGTPTGNDGLRGWSLGFGRAGPPIMDDGHLGDLETPPRAGPQVSGRVAPRFPKLRPGLSMSRPHVGRLERSRGPISCRGIPRNPNGLLQSEERTSCALHCLSSSPFRS